MRRVMIVTNALSGGGAERYGIHAHEKRPDRSHRSDPDQPDRTQETEF